MPEEENSGAAYSLDMDITFLFIAQKDESMMLKSKLHPEQKQPQYVANTTSGLCKHLHRQRANAKLAKNPEW